MLRAEWVTVFFMKSSKNYHAFCPWNPLNKMTEVHQIILHRICIFQLWCQNDFHLWFNSQFSLFNYIKIMNFWTNFCNYARSAHAHQLKTESATDRYFLTSDKGFLWLYFLLNLTVYLASVRYWQNYISNIRKPAFLFFYRNEKMICRRLKLMPQI